MADAHPEPESAVSAAAADRPDGELALAGARPDLPTATSADAAPEPDTSDDPYALITTDALEQFGQILKSFLKNFIACILDFDSFHINPQNAMNVCCPSPLMLFLE